MSEMVKSMLVEDSEIRILRVGGGPDILGRPTLERWQGLLIEDDQVIMMRVFLRFEDARSWANGIAAAIRAEKEDPTRLLGPKDWDPRTKRCLCHAKGA